MKTKMATNLQTDAPAYDVLDEGFDYTHVPAPARVAVYDDMKAPPRIIEIEPAPTNEFIETLSACINEQMKLLGGQIPYTPIREVAENFIHAQFKDMVVSILDGGNTVRFCDQGPGVASRERAVLPGFTSATEPMKNYIRGVGSGLPMVKSYLDVTNGRLTIEDNLARGAVVTISLAPIKEPVPVPLPILDEKQIVLLKLIESHGELGPVEAAHLANMSQSTAQYKLDQMQEAGLLEKDARKKRILTEYGKAVSKQI